MGPKRLRRGDRGRERVRPPSSRNSDLLAPLHCGAMKTRLANPVDVIDKSVLLNCLSEITSIFSRRNTERSEISNACRKYGILVGESNSCWKNIELLPEKIPRISAETRPTYCRKYGFFSENAVLLSERPNYWRKC